MNSSFPATSFPPGTPVKAKGSGCLKALLITTAILVVVIVGGAYYVSQNLAGWLRGGSSMVIEQLVEAFVSEAHLSPEETTRIRAITKKLTDKVAAGEISVEQGMGVMQKLAEGPLLGVGIAKGVEAMLPAMGLPRAEVEEGQKIAQRFAQGLLTQAIDPSKSAEALKLLGTNEDTGTTSKAKGITQDQVRAVLALMKQSVNEAGVPESVPAISLSQELDRAIERGLAEPVAIGK
jgi:hypothetical protein